MKYFLGFTFYYAVFIFKAAAQPLPADSARSHYITINLDIPQLQRKRNVQIYLPEDYYKSSKKYPVIYMQDAQNIYNKNITRNNCWYVDSLLKTLPDSKQVIIVGINHGGNQRIAEYSPYKSKYGEADGVAYTEFMVNTLKPYIDAHYRTKTDAKHTAIAGSSMGGLIALYASLKYPDVFGIAGIFSPAFWINPEINQFVTDAKISSKIRFFMACGDREGNETDDVNKMDALLRTKGISSKNMPAPLILKGEQHNENQWRKEFPVFYSWFVEKL